jgi:hypothetical protein
MSKKQISLFVFRFQYKQVGCANDRLLGIGRYICTNYFIQNEFCRLLVENASLWQKEDLYRNPGPIQFEGVGADLRTVTLSVEDQDYIGRINDLQNYLDTVLYHSFRKFLYPSCLYLVTSVCVLWYVLHSPFSKPAG